MALVKSPTNGQQSGSTGEPKTYAEAAELMRQLLAQEDDLIVQVKRIERRIDADFTASESVLEEYEREREAVQRRLDRTRRRAAHLADVLMPQLERSDKTAEASRHCTACEGLEYRMRPLRKVARDALCTLLKAVDTLDTLYAQHKQRATQYSATLEALERERTPNMHRAVELPEHARTRDHREALRLFWTALSSDAGGRDLDKFAEKLETLLGPFEPPVPPTFDEED